MHNDYEKWDHSQARNGIERGPLGSQASVCELQLGGEFSVAEF